MFSVNTEPLKRKLFADLFMRVTPVRFQLDSGATINLIELNVMRDVLGASFERAMRPAASRVTLYDGSLLETVGMTTATVNNPKNGETHVLDLNVTKSHSTPILGAEVCQAMNFLTVNYENIAAETSSRDVTSSATLVSLDARKREIVIADALSRTIPFPSVPGSPSSASVENLIRAINGATKQEVVVADKPSRAFPAASVSLSSISKNWNAEGANLSTNEKRRCVVASDYVVKSIRRNVAESEEIIAERTFISSKQNQSKL